MTLLVRIVFAVLVSTALASTAIAKVWGAKTSLPPDTPPHTLKPGEFVWDDEIVPAGPVAVIVSLDEQRAYVYRNGIQIGFTTVSTGKPGHETPTGIFTVLQKDKDHHSSKYNNASMPDTERLTWDGVALHAGGLPGYPSSHGCVHMPSVFAADLFEIAPMGMTVVIVNSKTGPADLNHPPMLAPINEKTGVEDAAAPLATGENWRWQPDASPDGPVSIIVSAADQRVVVMRNGLEIGRARVTIRDAATPLGTHAYILKHASGDAPLTWIGVAMVGYAAKGDSAGAAPATADAWHRLDFPAPFTANLRPLLVAGTTLLVTDAPILEENSGQKMTVVTSGAET
jgi:hypothetical protein